MPTYFVASYESKLRDSFVDLLCRTKSANRDEWEWSVGLFASILKEVYDDGIIAQLVYQTNPLLSMIPKQSMSGGAYMPVPITYKP